MCQSCRALDLPYQLTDFNGRSDYGPFIEPGVDIPGKPKFTYHTI